MLEALAVPELFAAVEDQGDDTTALCRQIEAASAVDELARHYAEGRISDREWFTARSTLADRLDDLRAQYPASGTAGPRRNDLPTDLEGLRALWEAATMEERRAILGLAVDEIVVGPGIVGGRRQTEADRLEVHWQKS